LEKLLEISFRANYAPSISELPQKVLKSKLRGFIKKKLLQQLSWMPPYFYTPLKSTHSYLETKKEYEVLIRAIPTRETFVAVFLSGAQS
jgi:hypothetical protein